MNMKMELKLFIKKTIIFCMPFIVLGLVAILMDPFKIYFNYEEYYKDNFVTSNRELICLKLFKKNIKKIKYNSYIFGSSRSQAYKIPEWKKYLEKNAVGFHFDASGEGIYGIHNKIKYIKSLNLPIENALIILDYQALQTTQNRKGYLFISPPELSGESKISFYREFLIANFDFKFIIGYIDYKINRKYRDYMKSLFSKAKYENKSDNATGDIYYGYDQMIQENQLEYYKNLLEKGVFYDRNKKVIEIEKPITNDEINILKNIHDLLIENKTKYKIVISPLYNQKKLSNERLNMLIDIFGDDNVFDFSGKNEYTESIYNYYEDSHYRPHIANEIMKEIYKD